MTPPKDEFVRRVLSALAERLRRQQDVMIGYIAAQRIKTARRNRRRRGNA